MKTKIFTFILLLASAIDIIAQEQSIGIANLQVWYMADNVEEQIVFRNQLTSKLLQNAGNQYIVSTLSLIHIPSPRDATLSRMPSSA